MGNMTYQVYARIDDAGRVLAINSSAFLHNTAGWTMIDRGHGDRFHHAQANYLPLPIFDENGHANWRLEDGRPVERNQEEKDADYTPPEEAPAIDSGNLAAEVAALRESNAQLQEALDLLLSGEVESDG